MKEIPAYCEHLKMARIIKGMSQKELAEKAGICPGTMSLIERGERTPSLKLMIFFQKLLGIDMNAIMDDRIITITTSARLSNNISELAVAIKEARENMGLTREQLAREMGCSAATISGYERGKQVPKGNKLVRLEDILKTKFNHLSTVRFNNRVEEA